LAKIGTHGQKTVSSAGTEEALVATALEVEAVTIKALAGNADVVYIGLNPVTSSTGFELSAGDSWTWNSPDPNRFLLDISLIFLDVGTNGEGVSYIATLP
jgi:hypothetical protein